MTAWSDPAPARIQGLAVPQRIGDLGRSLRDAERRFEIFDDADGLVNLTYADTECFPPPAWALAAFVAAATGGSEPYTPYKGDRQVRERLALTVGEFLGIDVAPGRELAITPGTQAGLYAALAATVRERETVLVVDPDYLCNERIVRYLDAAVETVSFTLGDGGAVLDLDAVERGFRGGARVLVMSHPNNPTGAVYSERQMRRLASLACEHDALVVIDQLYSRLVFDAPFPHLVAMPGMKERCVTLLGPSKTESMTGYRVGVMVAPAQVTTAVEDVQGVTAIRAPAYAQHTLVHWLADDREELATRIGEYRALRDMAYDRLSALEFVELHRSQGTSYLFPDVSRLGLDDHTVATALLEDAGVIVNPGYQFGRRGVGSFRICYAQDEAVWARVLEDIATVLTGLAENGARGERR